MSDLNPNHAAPCQKWGRGSDILTSAQERRRASAEFSRDDDDGWDGDFGPANDNDNGDNYGSDIHPTGNDDDDNPFESIGRALDQREEDVANKRTEEMESLEKTSQMDNNTRSAVNNHSPSNNDGRRVMDAPLGFDGKYGTERLSKDGNVEHLDSEYKVDHPPTSSECRLDEQTPAPSKFINRLSRLSFNGSTSKKSQNPSSDIGSQFSHASKRRRGSSIMKKMSPTRFSFQSSAKSKNTSLKTPSHKSLPSRALFSSNSVMSQKSSNKSTQKRKHRHTFRQSTDRTSNTPAVNNNVRDLGFVPPFLANAKGASGTSPKDAPAEDDDDSDSQRDNTTAFSQNIISGYAERQRQSHRKTTAESSSNAKSGYLVQRLRSLCGTDQRMAMRLRNIGSQCSTTGASGSALLSRKRRRSGGNDYLLDPKNTASSTLDVTISGSGRALGDDSRIAALIAYIHRYTVTKQPSGHQSAQQQGNGMTFPCFAWITMSHDGMREQSIDDGCTTKQIRFYDAVVIPPRVANMNCEQSAALDEVKQEDELHMNMPTIICTHVCQEYPAEQPLLEEVSFDRFI